MIDVLILLLLLITFYKAKIVKPISMVNEEYLSLDNCKQWRGFLALLIIFHHLTKNTSAGIFFPMFENVGYLAVGVFFFYSGYGLMKKRLFAPDYKKGFLKKRVLPLFITWLIVSALYCVSFIICGYDLKLKFLVTELVLKGNPIAEYSWYVVVILLFYLVFYLLLLTCKSDRLSIILSIAFYILFIAFCRILGYGEWWYNAGLTLMLGMTWALHEDKINDFIKNNYIKTLAITILIIALILTIKHFELYSAIPLGYLLVKILISCTFTFAVMLFSMKVTIKNKALTFLGNISLYLYLFQGMVMRLLHTEKIIYIENELLYASVCIVVIILIAYLYSIIDKKILKLLKLK